MARERVAMILPVSFAKSRRCEKTNIDLKKGKKEDHNITGYGLSHVLLSYCLCLTIHWYVILRTVVKWLFPNLDFYRGSKMVFSSKFTFIYSLYRSICFRKPKLLLVRFDTVTTCTAIYCSTI